MQFTKDPSTHPANGPLTEERLIRVREWLQSALAYSDGSNRDYMMADAAKAIDELLSVRKVDQEPAYFINKITYADNYGDDVELRAYSCEMDAMKSKADFGGTVIPVYAAPQLPQAAVVSDSLLSELLAIAKKAAYEADECAHAEWSDGSMEHSTAIADWERRAAMLQGADGNSPDGWVACSERMPEMHKSVWCFGSIPSVSCKDFGFEGWLTSGGFVAENNSSNPGVCEEANVTHWMPLPAKPQHDGK